MKYILMMNTMKTGKNEIFNWPKNDIQAHIAFMMNLNKSLRDSGELVSAEGLAWPDQARLLRDFAPQVLGAVARRYRDFAGAEDAVQEALLAASMQWPRDGVPENPRAWLIQVASRRMTDQVRSDAARRRRESAAAMEIGYA